MGDKAFPVKMIVAYDKHFGIGSHGDLPWRIPENMKHFVRETQEHALVMGYNTYKSIPLKFREMKNRRLFVVTYDPLGTQQEACDELGPYKTEQHHFGSTEAWAVRSALRACELGMNKGVFVAGGRTVYDNCIAEGRVDEVLASEVHGAYFTDIHLRQTEFTTWPKEVVKEYEDFRVTRYVRPSKEG